VLSQAERSSAHDHATVLAHPHLHDDDEQEDSDEFKVVEEVAEHVVLLVTKFARVDNVEDRHHHEDLEDHGEECALGSRVIVSAGCISSKCKAPDGRVFLFQVGLVKDLIHPVFLDIEWLVLIVILKIEKAHSSKQEDQENNDLVECMSENVAPHDGVDDLLVACVGLAFQKFFIRRLGCQGEGSKSVHDQVDPEHLDGRQSFVSEEQSTDKHDEHGSAVHCQLELKELSDIVIDVASVFDGDDDRAEVVVGEDDGGSVSADVSAGNAHGEAHVGLVQGRHIVVAVA